MVTGNLLSLMTLQYRHSMSYSYFPFMIKVFRDVAWEREILSLLVKCNHSDRGCEWVGQLRYYEVQYRLLLVTLHITSHEGLFIFYIRRNADLIFEQFFSVVSRGLLNE